MINSTRFEIEVETGKEERNSQIKEEKTHRKQRFMTLVIRQISTKEEKEL